MLCGWWAEPSLRQCLPGSETRWAFEAIGADLGGESRRGAQGPSSPRPYRLLGFQEPSEDGDYHVDKAKERTGVKTGEKVENLNRGLQPLKIL